MKNRLLSIIILLCAYPALAQRTDERVYVTTDRDWYAAGETLYLSAFCADVRDGVRLSSVSAIAYVELTSADGTSVCGKVALNGGRGGGSFRIPLTLPSGNYRLSAYTHLSTADPAAGSRIISVYNTLFTSRVPDGVTVGSAPDNPAFPPSPDCLRTEVLPDGRIRLYSGQDATLSVSVFRNGRFPSYSIPSFGEALKAPSVTVSTPEIPEYDGEIITLRLSRADGSPLTEQDSREVLISRPGHPGDVYATGLQPDGTARVFTGNLFGTGDMVITLDENAPAFRADVESPFRGVAAGPVPALVLDPSLEDRLSRLGVRMQITSAFDADTLYSRLPHRSLDLVQGREVHYALDDYTRFATLQEILVEYLSYIRVRRQGDDVQLQVCYRKKQDGQLTYGDGTSLILVDGVPVQDHSLVYNLDPALIRAVDVYPHSYYVGKRLYRGIANFVTFKGDMGGIRFRDNVRVLEFEGPSYPVAFSPSSAPGYPNQRETLLWHPMVELRAGEEWILPTLEADEGLVMVVEGLTADGTPVYYRRVFPN